MVVVEGGFGAWVLSFRNLFEYHQEPNGEFLSSEYSFTAIHFIVVIEIKSIISINNSDGITEKSM